jgi:CRP/FNR family transcriptional regulator, anaerobic regulatory protein
MSYVATIDQGPQIHAFRAPEAAERGGLRHTAQPKQHLFAEGDVRALLYQIERGYVKLYRTLLDGQRQIVGFAGPGDMIGLEFEREHLCGAEAVTTVEARALPVSRLGALCREDPDFAELLLREAGRQLAAAQRQLTSVGAQNAGQRVAAFLMSLAQDHADLRGPGKEVSLPMRRGDIAEYLGMRLETVSRKFSEFQKRGLIKLCSMYCVKILRPDILSALADGDDEEAPFAA